MTEYDAPSRREREHVLRVRVFALASLTALAAVGCLHFFVPTAFAPRINVRWADTIDDASRIEAERQLNLVAGAQVQGTTWAYDLVDLSPAAGAAIVAHPLIEDTHHIDRNNGTVSPDAPLGNTRIRGGLSGWRESPVVPWIARLSSSFVFLSAIWLATTGRRRPNRVAQE